MAKDTIHGFSERDVRRIQKAVRLVEDHTLLFRTYRRIRGQQFGGGTGIRNAFCKAAAGTGSTIACYLDTDGLNEAEDNEITVTCTLINATNLSGCFPTLADGTRMPVWKDGDTWRSLWWFQGNEECT